MEFSHHDFMTSDRTLISATNRKRFAAIHKHQKKLDIKINDCRVDKNNMEDIEIAIDSTGISIYNNTQQRK